MSDRPPIPPGSSDFDTSAAYLNLVRLMVYLHQGVNPAKAWPNLPKEPSFAQFKMLWMLRYLGNSSIKSLAHALGISAASASEMVDRLVELGLLDRQQDPQDRRRVIITLTQPAVKGVERHESQITHRLKDLLTVLGGKQATEWAEAMNAIGSHLQKISEDDT